VAVDETEGADEGDELVEDDEVAVAPSSKKKTKTKKKKRTKSESTKKATPKNLSKKLDMKQQRAGRDKVASKVLSKCKGKAAGGAVVRVSVTVSGSTGKVLSAKSSGAAGKCVQSVVKRSARFSRFKDAKQSFSIAFRF
jgi:hypothetical protein